MGTYILRRLLFMIPTLIGITFLIFMLIALSPGGIGAALRAAGGSMQADVGSRAIQEAYLEDRYGLDDPVVMQYLRWLGRVSPVKFGQRAQRLPDGEVITPSRELREPPLWRWFADTLPTPTQATSQVQPGDSIDDRVRAWRTGTSAAARARAVFVRERAQFDEALAAYLKDVGSGDLVDHRNKPDHAKAARRTPDRSRETWQTLQTRGDSMLRAYAAAVQAREEMSAVFRARLFEQVGIPLIPGTLSLGPPDLGQSFSRSRPVADIIATALPVTLLLNLLAFPIIYLIAIPAGMLAAAKQNRWQDTMLGAFFVALWSIPTVWMGVLAIGYLANKEYLGLFPVGGLHDKDAESFSFLPHQGPMGFERGYLFDALWHMALPVFCLVYGGFAVLSKQTRAAMLDNYNSDYVRTAKAKGVSAKDITFRHVFRNSLLPLITMFATVFPATLAGSVVIERIFSVPGMGSEVINAIYLRDRELLLANTMMIAAVNLLALLLADILYAFADPRISYK